MSPNNRCAFLRIQTKCFTGEGTSSSHPRSSRFTDPKLFGSHTSTGDKHPCMWPCPGLTGLWSTPSTRDSGGSERGVHRRAPPQPAENWEHQLEASLLTGCRIQQVESSSVWMVSIKGLSAHTHPGLGRKLYIFHLRLHLDSHRIPASIMQIDFKIPPIYPEQKDICWFWERDNRRIKVLREFSPRKATVSWEGQVSSRPATYFFLLKGSGERERERAHTRPNLPANTPTTDLWANTLMLFASRGV